MDEHVGGVFVPGDRISDIADFSVDASKILLGPGLRLESNAIVIFKPGILKFKSPNIYWVDSHQKRYIPVRGDHIIGVVVAKVGDIFKVDIGSSEQASLSYLAFEGTTKRNRPDVKVGDIVYSRLLVADKDIEPELVCIDGQGKSGGMGVIRNDGLLFHCSLNLVRKLLNPECDLLKLMGKSRSFEIVIGMNGCVWIKTKSLKNTIILADSILSAEHMTSEKIKAMCKKLPSF